MMTDYSTVSRKFFFLNWCLYQTFLSGIIIIPVKCNITNRK